MRFLNAREVYLSLIALGLMWLIYSTFWLPGVYKTIGRGRNASAANLSALGRSFLSYAATNDGAMPPDLETFIAETDLSPDMLISPGDANAPSTNDGEALYSSYIYLPGFKASHDPRMVLAYEREDINDGKGVYVLFLGGNAQWQSMEGFEEELEKTKAYLKQLADEANTEHDEKTNNAAGLE